MDEAFFDDTVVSNHTSSSFLIETTSSSSPKISKSSITVTGMKSSFSEPINIAHPPPLLLMIMMSSPSFSSSFSLFSNFTASKRAPHLNSVASRFTSNSDRLRSIGLFNGGCNGKKVVKRTPLMASLVGGETQSKESRFDLYQEVSKAAREKFNQVISVRSKDRDLSLAKALLYIAAEDEAFMAINRDMDAHSLENERRDSSISYEAQDWDCLEAMPLAGKCMSEWIIELDVIAKEVEAELVSRDIGCDLMEVMEAVNFVLFKTRGFKRFPVLLDSKFSYLHTVLNSGCGSAILLSIIYIEVCRRIGLNIVGSRVGEDFLIWPQTGNPEELFKVSSSGHSLFSIVNGSCVNDPRSKASDLNSKSLLGLDMASDRDIIGIALANLIRLHWKRASRANHGLMLTSPIRPVHESNEKSGNVDSSKLPLLRPLELRLAIMASERLLILQSHNWALRRDHGMLLYFSRKYPEAVQELSICMAFAPEEEAKALEPFVEKLHLLQIESSWKSLGHGSQLAVP